MSISGTTTAASAHSGGSRRRSRERTVVAGPLRSSVAAVIAPARPNITNIDGNSTASQLIHRVWWRKTRVIAAARSVSKYRLRFFGGAAGVGRAGGGTAGVGSAPGGGG